MKTLGKRLLIFGIILIALISGTCFYLYNFHTFQTLRICVGDAENLELPCEATSDCSDLILNEINDEISDVPDFIKKNLKRIVDETFYCNGTCFAKNVRGANLETRELEMLDSCNVDEKEIAIEIRGKDGFEIWKFLKDKNLS